MAETAMSNSGVSAAERARATRTLSDEIERYLATVDAFRRAGCEPRWRAERHGAKDGARLERFLNASFHHGAKPTEEER